MDYQVKKKISLGGRIGIGFFLIIIGIVLLVSGFLDVVYYENIKEQPKSVETESRSVNSNPELFWLPSYNINLEPLSSNFLEADKKIRIHVFSNSKQIMSNFEIHIFHEDLLETYSGLLESYINNSEKFPKLKNEWTSYAVFEINDATKCDVITEDGSITRREGCHFDYNAFNNYLFTNPGKYHVLFVTKLENRTNTGYLEKVSMFSLKDPLTVKISNKMESIVQLTESQQKLNFKAEGLSLIGIGVAMMIGGIAVFDSFVNAKRNYDSYEKEEEKEIYVEKLLVITLARTREQVRKTNEILQREQSVTQHVTDEWEKLRIPAERLETLIIMGTDSVNHQILDDVDLVKGTIIGSPSDDLGGVTNQLGQIEMLINSLIGGRLNQSRELVLNDSLENIERLRTRHLSADSTSQNQDNIRTMLELEENRIRRLYHI